MHVRKLLALIPAKAASKRLPGKNALVFDGESLVARAVTCARETQLFTDIVVSTEDRAVAELARAAGASVPFMRPPELAVDPAGVVDVTLHALDELVRAGADFDEVVILLPTSPFRTPADIVAALRLYRDKGVDFLMSVSRYDHSPLAAMIVADGLMEPLLPNWLAKSGAKAAGPIPSIVHSNGAVTICNVARLRQEKNYYSYPLAAYEMPWERGIDIDTPADLELAEFFLHNRPSGWA